MSTENIFEEVEKENNKNSDYMDELSPEELADLMSRYKKELARIYKLSSAKKASISSQKLHNAQYLLNKCDMEMRSDINSLKKKFGIHYWFGFFQIHILTQ